MNIYNNILKASGLLGSVQGLNILINLVRTKIVAILVGPTGVGLNGIYNETRELLHTTTNLGLDISGIRDISQAYEKGDKQEITESVTLLRTWVALLALIGMLITIALSAPLSFMTFDDYDHVWGYVVLSPAVAFSTITCGEMAVLKALRKLRKLAIVSVVRVALALLVSVPIYYFWGLRGIVPSLVLLFLSIMVSTMMISYKVVPLQLSFRTSMLKRGSGMLKVGANFVICNIMVHVMMLGILSYLNTHASAHIVGLYNAACTLTITYTGMVLTSIDQDYFPRLTGVVTDKIQRSVTLIKQQEVVLMLVAPMIVALIIVIPILVPLLLTSEFTEMIPMAQAASVGMIFRALYLPYAYLPLAAGDNRIYFAINVVGALDLLLVIVGYIYGGLLGMGIALTIQNGIDMLLVMLIGRYKYEVKLSAGKWLSLMLYIALVLVCYAVTYTLTDWEYWTAGGLLIIIVCVYSFIQYKKGNKETVQEL